MGKSKQTINEDVTSISKLINYDRGLTSVENETIFEDIQHKLLINEVQDIKAERIAKELYDSMKGAGTDEDAFWAIIQPTGREGLTREDQEAIQDAFRSLYDEELEDWLEGDFSGDELSRAKKALGIKAGWLGEQIGVVTGAAGVGTTLATTVGAPLLAAGTLYGLWKWAVDAWGSKSISKRIRYATNQDTWARIVKSIKETSIALGKDIMPGLQVITRNKAKSYAQQLMEAMGNGFDGTDKRAIAQIMNKIPTFTDLARVSYEFGKPKYSSMTDYGGTKHDLGWWLDEELGQRHYNEYFQNIMSKKPLLIYERTIYDDLKSFTTMLEETVQTKKDKPANDDRIKNNMIMAIKGKFGDCMTEILKTMPLMYTKKRNRPYILYTDATNKLAIFPTGRFQDLKKKGADARGTLTVCATIDESWSFKSKFIAEQIKIKYDNSDEIINVTPVTPADPTDNTPKGDVDTEVKKKKTRSGQRYVRVTYTFEDILGGKETGKVGDINKDEEGAIWKIQETVGAKADGVYGPNTKRAVETFQRRNGLDVTGIFGVEEAKKSGPIGEVGTETDGSTETNDTDAKKGAEVVTNKEIEDITQTITTDSDVDDTLEHLKTIRQTKLDKPSCIQLVVAANAALPNLVPEILPKLQACFYDYNFPNRIGRRAD